jgi:hypothetical protein
MRLPDAESSQRWQLFVNPRACEGLNLLCRQYGDGDKLYSLIHAIGSGILTILPEPDLDLAKQVSQPAIDRQRELSRKSLAGDMSAMLEQRQVPADLDTLRISVLIEHTVRLLLIDLAAKFNAHHHQGSQKNSVSALLKAIGLGEMTLLNIVDPAVRLKYLRNTRTVKEYICLQKAKRAQDFHESQQTKC